MQYGPLSGPVEPTNARDIEFERCECLEWAYATCFDCEAALCEDHAVLLPGTVTLFVCATCLANRQPQTTPMKEAA